MLDLKIYQDMHTSYDMILKGMDQSPCFVSEVCEQGLQFHRRPGHGTPLVCQELCIRDCRGSDQQDEREDRVQAPQQDDVRQNVRNASRATSQTGRDQSKYVCVWFCYENKLYFSIHFEGPKSNTIGFVKLLRHKYSKDTYSDPTSCTHVAKRSNLMHLNVTHRSEIESPGLLPLYPQLTPNRFTQRPWESYCHVVDDVFRCFSFKMFSSTMLQVSQYWWGRKGCKTGMPESLEMFMIHTVQPCIDCEPGHALKESYLNRLIDFMASEEGTSRADLDMVRQICTGKIRRHPALHGAPWICNSELWFGIYVAGMVWKLDRKTCY